MIIGLTAGFKNFGAGGGGGGPRPTVVGSGGDFHLTTLSLAMPTHVADDILLVAVETENHTAATPAGWTQLYRTTIAPATGFQSSLSVFWRRATAPGTANFQMSSGNHHAGIVAVIRGCPTTGNPFDVSALQAMTNGNTGTITLPSITTLQDNALIIFIGSNGFDSTSAAFTPGAVVGGNTTNKAGITGFKTSQNHGGNVQMSSAELTPAGSTGVATIGALGSDKVAGVTISFPPA